MARVLDNATHWWSKDRQALRQAERAASRELPADWLEVIGAEARQARPQWGGRVGHPLAAREVWQAWTDEYGGAVHSDLSDAEIKARAAGYALEARAMELGELAAAGAWHEFARLVEFCRARDVEPPPVRLLLQGMASRVRCPYWWRRALRRMVARKCERGAMALGLVSKPAGQPYASNSAVWRRVDQNKRNQRAAEFILFENDEGRVSSLAALIASSTSNKAIRRGELMTRIRGCEEIADELGHPGLFLTLTCPSRFHSTLRDGKRNKKHDGSTPRDAQQWLCGMWAKARAKLARKGITLYGFRVAEPHHDGCTHWHGLFWAVDEEALKIAEEVIRSYWLSDDGDEPGAAEYRMCAKRMERGGAAGYIAKYIAKNIDDHAIDSHLDDYAEGEIGLDLLGDVEIKPSMRVEAWAATWGVRQFQAIGQPPVGVWRELRRVKEEEARRAGFGGVIYRAWAAAQRMGAILADWARYVKAQGGVMLGRKHKVVVRHEVHEAEGLYGRAQRRMPVGVSLNLRCARIVWSNRRLWRPIEASEEAMARMAPAVRGARSAAPRTRVNNCTADDEASALQEDFLRGKGGVTAGVDPPCIESDATTWRSKPPPSPNPAP